MTCALSAINARSACDELRDKVQADHMSVHPEQLVIPKLRLREIKPNTIRELAESIQEVGLLEPIGVKHAGANTNRYVVIYGARRALACQLLHREAMAKATDPNTDQEVFRYTQIQALRFRHEIPNDVCEELEIRENMDRKELTHSERKAQALLLGAIMQPRLKKRAKDRKEDNGKSSHDVVLSTTSTHKHTRRPDKPVTRAVAEALGVNPQTLANRVASASADVGQRLDLDSTAPTELKAAARLIREQEEPPRKGKGSVPSEGRILVSGQRRLTLNLDPADAAPFADWMRKRYTKTFSLDDIRAYRDALSELIKELEG